MNRSGGEAFAKLAQQLNRARLQASRAAGGGGGGGAGGGGPGLPSGGALAGGGLLLALAGGGLLLNSSLFNGEFPISRTLNRRERGGERKEERGKGDRIEC
jgi:prohibitin 2